MSRRDFKDFNKKTPSNASWPDFLEDEKPARQKLISKQFEGKTVAEAEASALSAISKERVKKIKIIQNAAETTVRGIGNTSEAAITAANEQVPSTAFDISPGEVYQKHEISTMDIQAFSGAEADEYWQSNKPEGGQLEAMDCIVAPTKGFFSGKKAGLWKARYSTPFKAYIKFKTPATIQVFFERSTEEKMAACEKATKRKLAATRKKNRPFIESADKIRFVYVTPENAKQAKELFENGNALYNLNNPDETKEYFAEANRLDPTLKQFWVDEANTLLVRNEFDEARRAIQKAFRLDFRYAPAHNSMGNHDYRRGEFFSAMLKFEEALKLDPKSLEIMMNKGVTCYALGCSLLKKREVKEAARRFYQARDIFQQILKKDPKNAEAKKFKDLASQSWQATLPKSIF